MCAARGTGGQEADCCSSNNAKLRNKAGRHGEPVTLSWSILGSPKGMVHPPPRIAHDVASLPRNRRPLVEFKPNHVERARKLADSGRMLANTGPNSINSRPKSARSEPNLIEVALNGPNLSEIIRLSWPRLGQIQVRLPPSSHCSHPRPSGTHHNKLCSRDRVWDVFERIRHCPHPRPNGTTRHVAFRCGPRRLND